MRGMGTTISFGLVVALGLLHLAYPLLGDQALFLLYARGIDGGARLYVDLWDNKQPGVFWFYWAAGRVFGFTPGGMHALELVWMVVAAGALWIAARVSFETRSATAIVPLLTVGLYYWACGPGYLTEVEALVAMPLAVCLLIRIAGTRGLRTTLWPIVFGFFAGVVAILKLVLIVVPLAMWLAPALIERRLRRDWRAESRLFGLVLLGLSVPLAATAAHFWFSGSWSEFFWTQFIYPSRAVLELQGKTPGDFVRGASWLAIAFLPSVPVLLFAFAKRRGREFRLIETLSLAWLAAGLAAIAVQKFSWWSYHFVLLLPPAGMLVGSALDRVAAQHPGRLARAVVFVSVIAIYLAGGYRFDQMRQAVGAAMEAPEGRSLVAFRTAIDPTYERRREDAAFLRSSGRSDPIYVFGDPRWLLDGERKQATPIHGWAWESMLSDQWGSLPQALSNGRPEYIHLSLDYADMVAERSPETMELIHQAYVPARLSFDGGWWYRRKTAQKRSSPG